MNFDIAYLLAQDGVATGAIYAMIALGVVLTFTVTRVVFVSFGDLIAYAALTLASIQLGELPGTVWLIVLLVAASLVTEAVYLIRHRQIRRFPRAILNYAVVPLIPVAAALLTQGYTLSMPFQILLTIALILPLGPLLYRVVFRPMLDASVLALLMAAVALHFVLAGLSLLFFGAEGFKTEPYASGQIGSGNFAIPTETVIIVVAVLVFISVLYFFFEHSLTGKALRATAVNRIGARIVGIRTTDAGSLAFLLAAGMAAIAGVLIGPIITVYYDSGFLIGLKGFVGAVIGGFVSYPMTAIGSLVIAMIESFSSFYSSAYKDAIVFAALIPIVILRWLLSRQEHDNEEEEEL